MENRSYALFTGLFVLGLGAAILIAALWLADRPAEDRVRYVVHSEHSVTGLNPQSAVEYRGLRVGQVEGIALDAAEPGRIRITISVDAEVPVTHGTYARLRTQGVTGLAVVELGDDQTDTRPLESTREEPARIPMRPSLITEITDSGQEVMTEIQALAGNLNALLSEENREQASRILTNTADATERLVALQASVEEALAGIPGMEEDLGQTLSAVEELARNLDDLTDDVRLRMGRLDDAGAAVERLSDAGDRASRTFTEETLPEVDRTLEEIRRAARSLDELGRTLREDPTRVWRGAPVVDPGPGEEGYRRTQ